MRTSPNHSCKLHANTTNFPILLVTFRGKRHKLEFQCHIRNTAKHKHTFGQTCRLLPHINGTVCKVQLSPRPVRTRYRKTSFLSYCEPTHDACDLTSERSISTQQQVVTFVKHILNSLQYGFRLAGKWLQCCNNEMAKLGIPNDDIGISDKVKIFRD